MTFDKFFLYFVLPAFTVILVVTNRIYYQKKDTVKTRFNISEDLFYGNILGPTIAVVTALTIYAYILNIRFVFEMRWEMLSIFSIAILLFFIGMGTGGHIAAISIERSLDQQHKVPKLEKAIHFFHWPFGHKLTFVPTLLVLYVLILLDLFRGIPIELTRFELFILSAFAIVSSIIASVTFIFTHVTKIVFFTLSILSASIFLTLLTETKTLVEHQIAYFFTVGFVSSIVFLGLYRYSHHVSESIHTFIHSKFPEGDKISFKQEVE